MTVYVVFNCRKCGRKYQINDVDNYIGLCPTCLGKNVHVKIDDSEKVLLV